MVLTRVDLRAVIARAVDDVPGASGAVSIDGTFGILNGDDVLLPNEIGRAHV